MRSSQPPLEYLIACSQIELESFEFSRLGQIADLRGKIGEIHEEWIEAEVAARLARLLLESRRGECQLESAGLHNLRGSDASLLPLESPPRVQGVLDAPAFRQAAVEAHHAAPSFARTISTAAMPHARATSSPASEPRNESTASLFPPDSQRLISFSSRPRRQTPAQRAPNRNAPASSPVPANASSISARKSQRSRRQNNQQLPLF